MDLGKLHLHWRVSQYQGNTYRSYSLARSLWQDGKNRKEIVLKLGKLTEDEVLKWQTFLQFVKKPNSILTTLSDIIVTNHYAYLDVAVVNELWNQWALDDVFRSDEPTILEFGYREARLSNIPFMITEYYFHKCISFYKRYIDIYHIPYIWI